MDIANRCGNVFVLKDKTFKFVFRLQSTIQTIDAHVSEKLDDKRWLFENVIEKAWKEGAALLACLAKLTVARKVLYVSLRSEQDNGDSALVMYGTRNDRAYSDSQKQVMPSPRISALIGHYGHRPPERVDQPLQKKRQAISKNIVCQHIYAHGHYSPDYRLSYGRWKNFIANFETSKLTEQKTVPRHFL